jgi:hypothetical protein
MFRPDSYHFITEWAVEGTLCDVASILRDVEAFPRWWRPVYLSATILDPGASDGVGRIVEFKTRGFLPYVLRWRIRVVESREPYGFTCSASGDLIGTGAWDLRQDGTWVRVRLDWRVRARKTVVRLLSFALRPLVARNHAWAMAKGQAGLQAQMRAGIMIDTYGSSSIC